MNTVLTEPCRWIVDSTNAENEIRDIFYHHWMKLKDHVITKVNEINEWRGNIIAQVNKYADEQVHILVEDCAHQRLILDQKHMENLETTRAYWAAQNGDLFNELRHECQLLEVQAAQLEEFLSTIKCHKVITVQEQVERKKKASSDTPKLENDKPEEKPMAEHNNISQDNRGQNAEFSVKVESSISNEIDSHPTAVASSNNDTRSISNNSALIITDDDSINKCPICFMIFHSSMTQTDRSRHVNEHCTDD